MQQLKSILSQSLKSDTEKIIFELSDGSRGTREIAALAGLGSNATVAAYWKKWSRLGIVEPTEKYQGRYERICSLEQVGLDVPPFPTTSEVTKGATQPKIDQVTQPLAETGGQAE